MKKMSNKIVSIVLSMIMVLAIFSTPVAQAAEPTADNAVIFTVRGGIEANNVRYSVIVDGVYNQTYQSFNITYPKELQINYPTALAGLSTSTYNFSNSSSGNTVTATFITRVGVAVRTAAQLKTDLESIYFTLVDLLDGFPPENSKVSIQASATKVTAFTDEQGYVHYYEYISGAVTWLTAYNAAHGRTMQDPRFPDDPGKKLYGYLATITSQSEQRKLYSDIATECGWLGGTRMLFGMIPPGHTTKKGKKIQDEGSKNPGSPTTINISTIINIANYITTTAANQWYWADGPEAWTVYDASREKYTYYPMGMTTVPQDAWVIRDGSGNDTYLGAYDVQPVVPDLPVDAQVIADPNRGAAVTPLVFYNKITHTATPAGNGAPAGVYANWDNPYGVNVDDEKGKGLEPNNANSEYVVQFAYTGKDLWNDFANAHASTVDGYYVEYGGYQGDPLASELGGSDVSTSSEVELVMPIIVRYRSTVMDGAINRLISGVGHAYDRIITYETHLPYTAVRNDPSQPQPGAAAIPGYTAYGYAFTGVLEDEDRLTNNAAGDVSGFHSTNYQQIVFLFKPNDYTVTFDANYSGWNSASVSPGSKTVQFDSPYGTLAAATRSGYMLTGWYRTPADVDQGANPILATTIVPVAGNHTLYAGWAENTDYVVRYDTNGGSPDSIPDMTGVSWTDSCLLPAPPTRTGYLFIGWDVLAGGTKQGVTESDTYGSLAANDAEASITLQAQWMEEHRIIVFYHLNGAETPSLSELPDGEVFSLNEEVDFPDATRRGYGFAGWKVSNNGFGVAGSDCYEGGTTGITYESLAGYEDPDHARFVVLEAQWVPKDYTLSYDRNDPAPDSYGTPVSGPIWERNGFVPPAVVGNPTRTGYLFMGWNTRADGLGRVVNVSSTYAQLANGDDETETVVLYAQWQNERTYFIRYDVNGGTPTPDPLPDRTVYLATDNLLPALDPTPPVGHEFAGWTVVFNGSKSGVTSTDTFGDLADNPNVGYIILQAQYAPKQGYSVHYDLNGTVQAGYPTQKTDVVWTQNHLLPNADPVRTNFTFLGWNTVAAGSGIPATSADRYGVLAAGTDQPSVTLYAQWAGKDIYTVRYELNGGTGSIPNETLALTDIVLAASEPDPPSGYTFSHWEVADNGYGMETKVRVTGSQQYKDLAYGNDTTPYRGYIVLRAMYAEMSGFTMYYNWNHGDTPQVDTIASIKWTDSGFTPHTATRPGWNLLGWTLSQDGSGNFVLPATQYKNLVSTDAQTAATLYAQWEYATFRVRYDLNGVDAPAGNTDYDQRTVGFDDGNLIPPGLRRAGYDLQGWIVSENGATANVVTDADSYRTLAAIGAPYITLQAQWVAKTYTVHYDVDGGFVSDPAGIADKTVFWADGYLLPVLPAGEPLKDGYTFSHWKLWKIDEELISDGAQVMDHTKYSSLAMYNGMDEDNITLQAVYEELSDVTINYTPKTVGSDGDTVQADELGGSVDPASQSIAPATGSPSATASAHAGYTFVGWYAADDTMFSIALSTEETFTPERVDGLNVAGSYVALFKEDDDVTISYAQATVNADGIAAQTASNGGAIDKTVDVVAPATGSPSVTASAHAGYTFVGWYAEDDTTFGTALATEATFTPVREDGLNVEGSYVALFKEDDDVTITYTTDNLNADDENPGGSVGTTSQSLAPATGTVESSVAVASAGYHFVGWYVLVADYEDEAPITIEAEFTPSKVNGAYEEKTYVAVFAEDDDVTISYAPKTVGSDGVTVQADELGGSVDPTSQSVAPVTGSPSATASTHAGYTFVGWYDAEDTDYLHILGSDEHFVPDTKVGGVNVAGSYVALFMESGDVAIAYIASPGGFVSNTTDIVKPVSGIPAGSTASAANGYNFLGWYVYGIKISDDATFIPGKANGVYTEATHIAMFEAEVTVNGSYKVEHYRDGGETLYETEVLCGVIRSTVTAAAKNYTGYTYQADHANEVKTGTVMADGGLVLRLYYILNKNDIIYTVTGAEPPGAPPVPAGETGVLFGDTKTVEDELVFTGYVFSGWSTSDCRIEEDGRYNMPDGDVTFTGSWILDEEVSVAGYTIEHCLAGQADPYETEKQKGLSGTLATASPKNGYIGYSYEAGAVGERKEGEVDADGSLVLRLYYTANTHEIHYRFSGDIPSGMVAPASISGVPYGDAVLAERDPSYAGYTFSGWWSAECTVVGGAFLLPDSDVAFIGIWAENPGMFKVEFVDWSGNSLKAEFVPDGWDATAPANPARPGYTFVGWDKTYENITADHIITALYEADPGFDTDTDIGSGDSQSTNLWTILGGGIGTNPGANPGGGTGTNPDANTGGGIGTDPGANPDAGGTGTDPGANPDAVGTNPGVYSGTGSATDLSDNRDSGSGDETDDGLRPEWLLPQTGEKSNRVGWVIVLPVSLIGIFCALLWSKWRKRNSP